MGPSFMLLCENKGCEPGNAQTEETIVLSGVQSVKYWYKTVKETAGVASSSPFSLELTWERLETLPQVWPRNEHFPRKCCRYAKKSQIQAMCR